MLKILIIILLSMLFAFILVKLTPIIFRILRAVISLPFAKGFIMQALIRIIRFLIFRR